MMKLFYSATTSKLSNSFISPSSSPVNLRSKERFSAISSSSETETLARKTGTVTVVLIDPL